MTDIVVTSDLHHGLTQNTAKRLEKFFNNIKEKVDPGFVLLVAGDLIAVKQDSFKKCIKLLRRVLPDNIIGIVRGNHCYYDYNVWKERKISKITISQLKEKHRELAQEYNIHLLEENPIILPDVEILGVDGGVEKHDDYDYDSFRMANPDEGYSKSSIQLKDLAHEEFKKIVNSTKRAPKSLLATHYPLDIVKGEEVSVATKYKDQLTKRFDYIVHGHIHKKYYEEVNDCIIECAGSGPHSDGMCITEQWYYSLIQV